MQTIKVVEACSLQKVPKNVNKNTIKMHLSVEKSKKIATITS